MDFELDFDLRTMDALWAISALQKFSEVVEAQMEEVHRCERLVLDGERPTSGGEEEHHIQCSRENELEQLYEQDLISAMRYSFVVLIHTVFERHLRAFCKEMQNDRKIPISLSDLSGSAIERVRTYLTKLAGLPAGDFPEWEQLRTFQKIRDCIVHSYGYVAESRDAKELRQLVSQNMGVTIDDYGRLALTKAFGDRSLACLDKFFERLFRLAGWIP